MLDPLDLPYFLYLKCRSNGFEFFFFSKNHLHQVNPETKSRCGCVDNISWGDAVFVLFCLQCFCIQNSPCLPQWTKSTKEIKFLFVPKLLLFKIFHIFLSKRLQVRDYHPTITLSFKTNLLNAIKLLLTYHCQYHGTFQCYSIAPFRLRKKKDNKMWLFILKSQ